ncbi:MAG TPA: VOC family protein [Candidatus Acidoferrales bacterium]|nr:VOC family protein [Candidatus Acidoferrales bacterium]
MSVQSTPAAGTAVLGMDLIGCIVTDLKKELAFYSELGLVPAKQSENGAEFHFPDGSTFGLWQPPESEDVPIGYSFMFTVADAAAAAQRAREGGATIGEAFESPVCHMAMGEDCEGNSIILHQKKTRDEHVPPKTPRTLTSINGIDLAGYLVADAPRAVTFYRDVLGLESSYVDEQNRGAEFELADGTTFGVWHEAGAPTGGFAMFAVDDARAKVAELRSRGIEIGDADEGEGCFMALGADPEGNCFVIHQRKGHG